MHGNQRADREAGPGREYYPVCELECYGGLGSGDGAGGAGFRTVVEFGDGGVRAGINVWSWESGRGWGVYVDLMESC